MRHSHNIGLLKKEGKHSDLHCNRCAKTMTLDGYSPVLPPKMLFVRLSKNFNLNFWASPFFSRGVRSVNFARIYFWASPFFRGVRLVIISASPLPSSPSLTTSLDVT